MAAIKVVYVRSGGFGGLRMRTVVNSTDGDPDGPKIDALVDALAGSHVAPARPAGRPDGFQHDLTIERGMQHLSFTARDPLPPGPLTDLIEVLQPRAQPVAPGG